MICADVYVTLRYDFLVVGQRNMDERGGGEGWSRCAVSANDAARCSGVKSDRTRSKLATSTECDPVFWY